MHRSSANISFNQSVKRIITKGTMKDYFESQLELARSANSFTEAVTQLKKAFQCNEAMLCHFEQVLADAEQKATVEMKETLTCDSSNDDLENEALIVSNTTTKTIAHKSLTRDDSTQVLEESGSLTTDKAVNAAVAVEEAENQSLTNDALANEAFETEVAQTGNLGDAQKTTQKEIALLCDKLKEKMPSDWTSTPLDLGKPNNVTQVSVKALSDFSVHNKKLDHSATTNEKNFDFTLKA